MSDSNDYFGHSLSEIHKTGKNFPFYFIFGPKDDKKNVFFVYNPGNSKIIHHRFLLFSKRN
jgi:hypothetical protein